MLDGDHWSLLLQKITAIIGYGYIYRKPPAEKNERARVSAEKVVRGSI